MARVKGDNCQGTRTSPVCNHKALWIVIPSLRRELLRVCDRCLPNVLPSRSEVLSVSYKPRPEKVEYEKGPSMSDIRNASK